MGAGGKVCARFAPGVCDGQKDELGFIGFVAVERWQRCFAMAFEMC